MRFKSLRQRTTWTVCTINTMYTRFGIAIRHYRLLFFLSCYWDELAKLDWWLLLSDEALGMPERVRAEHDKLLIFAELGELSKRHERLFNGFLEFGMLGRDPPQRPSSPIA